MKTRTVINTIIESPYLGFWRVCSKSEQKKYRKLNRKDSDVDRAALLHEVVTVYANGLDKMACMPEKEVRAKKERVAKLICKISE